jgi:hypothetical protein
VNDIQTCIACDTRTENRHRQRERVPDPLIGRYRASHLSTCISRPISRSARDNEPFRLSSSDRECIQRRVPQVVRSSTGKDQSLPRTQPGLFGYLFLEKASRHTVPTLRIRHGWKARRSVAELFVQGSPSGAYGLLAGLLAIEILPALGRTSRMRSRQRRPRRVRAIRSA